MKKNQLIIVLGMHRSGTSAIASGLQALGFNLGTNLLPPMTGVNEKGFFEDRDIVALNEEILLSNNALWHDLRFSTTLDSRTVNLFKIKAVELVRRKIDEGVDVIKDPRFLILLPFWISVFEYLKIKPTFVVVVRNPISVAHSLISRDNFDLEKCYLLWLIYFIPALRSLVTEDCFFVSFERFSKHLKFELARIAKKLDVKFDEKSQKINKFIEKEFDSKLIHSKFSIQDLDLEKSIPKLIPEIYKYFEMLSIDQLDHKNSVWQNQAESALSIFDNMLPFFSYATKCETAKNQLIDRVGDYHNLVLSRDATIEAIQAEVLSRDATIEAIQAEVLSRDATIEAIQAEVLSRDATIEAIQAELENKCGEYHNLVMNLNNRINDYHNLVSIKNDEIELLKSSLGWRIQKYFNSKINNILKFSKIDVFMPFIKKNGVKELLRRGFNYYKVNELKKTIYKIRGIEASLQKININNESFLTLKKDFLPVNESNILNFSRKNKIDIIIPVYKNLLYTKNCIESVLNSNIKSKHRIIIINDASPDNEVNEYIENLHANKKIIIIKNRENLGFVKSVNKGMSLSEKNDIVLLNSDTEVSNNWLDKLAWHAYSAEKVATVTPFSNNATICSFPSIEGSNAIAGGMNVQEIDKAFSEVNSRKSVEIPTGVGFCMYIRRGCLKEIGLFDDKNFGKGYGEENDFCLRAINNGWVNLFAGDTFVYHAGEVSFGNTSSIGKANASKIINKMHPNYEHLIQDYIAQNLSQGMRFAAAIGLLKKNKKPNILLISHNLGGGTEKHILSLINSYSPKINFIQLRPSKAGSKNIEIEIEEFKIKATLPSDDKFIVDLLRSLNLDKIHIHHTLGFEKSILSMIREVNVPYIYTVHDYYSLCPKITFFNAGEYCGEPTENICNDCILSESNNIKSDINFWRLNNKWLFDGEAVLCPSEDVNQRILKYHPHSRNIIEYHDESKENSVENRSINDLEYIEIVIIGWLVDHKGLRVVRKILDSIKLNELKIKIHLIGSSEGELSSNQVYREHGQYKDDQLQSIISDIDPHLIWIPGVVPETYSFTLSAAIDSKKPIMLSNLGALGERVEGRPFTWVYSWKSSAQEILELIEVIRKKLTGTRALSQWNPVIKSENYYETEYLNYKKTEVMKFDKILMIPEYVGGNPSPCAYIRLILPTVKMEASDQILIINTEELKNYKNSKLITHRIAIAEDRIDEVLEVCKNNNIEIIYDLDDDLLSIGNSNHPEAVFYSKYEVSIKKLIISAARVTCSTEILKTKLEKLNKNVVIFSNKLSKVIWEKNYENRIRDKGKKIKIIYMGTKTHERDFRIIEEALIKIKKKYAKDVEINIIGIIECEQHDFFNIIKIPSKASVSYPMFVRWLLSLGTADIGLAPLVSNDFNRYKSNLKYLDYSILNMAVIASDCDIYRSIISDGVNGSLAINTSESWFTKIEELIISDSLRNKYTTESRKLLNNYIY
jgi:GT2 family glycosyltransferase